MGYSPFGYWRNRVRSATIIPPPALVPVLVEAPTVKTEETTATDRPDFSHRKITDINVIVMMRRHTFDSDHFYLETAMAQIIQCLLSSATSPTIGPAVPFRENEQVNVRVVATAHGDVGATLNLEGSFDGNEWFGYVVIDLAGTTTVAHDDVFETYPHIRANLTTLSGTDAKATVFFHHPGR